MSSHHHYLNTVWWETLANLANDHEFAKFSPAKFKKVSHNKILLRYYWNTSMLILKYFNRTPTTVQDQGLPEPTGSLSNFVPPKALRISFTNQLFSIKWISPQTFIFMISSYHGIQQKRVHHCHFLLSSQVCRVA